MAFLGNRPAENYISYDVQHFTTSATTSYTLDHAVANENELRLVINNVVQQPGSSYAYSASGTSLTLTSATSATDTMYCVYLGKAVQTVTPPNGSVTSAKLATLTSAMDFQGVASDMRLNFDTTDTVAIATPLMAITAKNKTDSVAQISMRRESAVDDGYIAFSTQATGGAVTEKVRIHSNGVMSATQGIALGVGTANTSSNVLDDYEEGTWTPLGNSASGFSTGITSHTGSTYTKIGNVVQVRSYIQMGNSSGNLALEDNVTITGLPFTAGQSETSMTNSYRYNSNNGLFGVYLSNTTSLFVRCMLVNGSPVRSGGAIALNYIYRTT